MKINFMMIVLIFELILISCTSIDSRKYFERSEENYNNRKFSEALIDLDSGLAINPNYLMQNFEKGRIFYFLEKYDSAFFYLSNFIDLNPKNTTAYYFRSLSRHALLGNNNIDFSDINRALYLDANNNYYYNYRAELYKISGKYDAALKDLNMAIKIYELEYRNFYSRCLLKFNFLNDTIGAIEDIHKSIELAPENPYCSSSAGTIYFHLKKYEEAEKYFLNAISIDTTLDYSYYKLGLTRKHFKDYDKALYYLNKAIRIDSIDQYFYVGRADIEYELGNYKESVVDYDKALEINPFNGDAHYGKGKSNFKLRNFKDAIECLNKSFTLRDTQEDIGNAYYYCGLCKLEINDNIGACQDFTMAQSKGNIDAKEKIIQFCSKKK